MAVLGLLGSLVIAVESLLISSPWLTYLSGIGVVTAWLFLRGGRMKWQTALGLTSLLWITLPFPAGYDDKLIQYLQRQSSFAASSILDCIGVVHLPEGNVLELPGKKLFVDEACSGVDSLYALMAICLTIVLYLRQPFPVAVVSLSLVPIWASCSNIARLVVIVLGISWFNVDLSTGMPHTILGLVVFTGAFLCDLAFIRFAGAMYSVFKFGRRSKSTQTVQQELRPVRIPRFVQMGFGVMVALCFVAVGIRSAPVLYAGTLFKFPDFTEESLASIRDQQNLPKQIGEWNFRHFEVIERNRDSSMGHYSHLWLYQAPEGEVTISTDFPFRGFHLLDICYEGAGWRMIEAPQQVTVQPDNPNDTSGAIYPHLLSMTNDEGRHGYIVYGLFQMDGKAIQSQAKAQRGFERFEQKVMEPVSFQIQLMLNSADPISKQTQQMMMQRYLALIKTLRPTFRSLVEKSDQ